MPRGIARGWSAVGILLLLVSASLAERDADVSMEEAREAYAAGRFAEARDLADKASETSPNDAEVFLMLARARYQLGNVDEAITAWRRAIRLAPKNTEAKRMLVALTEESDNVELLIRLLEVLVDDSPLHPNQTIEATFSKLFNNRALTDAQRAQVLLARARWGVLTKSHATTVVAIRQIQVELADHADEAMLKLLMGQAKLLAGGDAAFEGVKLLLDVKQNHADSPAAVEADLELLLLDSERQATPRLVDGLLKWMQANTEHPRIAQAMDQLLETGHAVNATFPLPDVGEPLPVYEMRLIEATAGVYTRTLPAEQCTALITRLLEHLKNRYAAQGRPAIATAGAKALLGSNLTASDRLLVLRAKSQFQTVDVLANLTRQIKAGELPAEAKPGAGTETEPKGNVETKDGEEARAESEPDTPALPAELAAVVEEMAVIRKAFPTQYGWADQLALAAKVRALATLVDAPAKVTELKSPDAWALAMALPATESIDAEEVGQVVALVQAIVDDYAKLPNPEARPLTLTTLDKLRERLPLADPAYVGPLTEADRVKMLQGWTQIETTGVLADLERQAKGGKLPGAPALPAELAAVVEDMAVIRKAFPTQYGWADQLALAEQVRALTVLVDAPAKVTELKSPDAWASAVALPATESTDAAEVQQVVALVQAIVDDYAKLPNPEARPLTLTTLDKLRERLPLADPAYVGPLTEEDRMAILRSWMQFETTGVLGDLERQAKTGQLPAQWDAPDLPANLAAVVEQMAVIRKAFPTQYHWADQLALAEKTREFGSRIPRAAKVTGLKSVDVWALRLALPATESDDSEQVKRVVALVGKIIEYHEKLPNVEASQLALDVSGRLLARLDEESPEYRGAGDIHVKLLDVHARREFDENVKKGRGEKNKVLSPTQKQLLGILVERVKRSKDYGPTAWEILTKHVAPWKAHRHWDVIETAHGQLATVLPAAQQRTVELASIDLDLDRVEAEHNRLTLLGLAVPASLDPIHQRALERCYQLQATAEEDEAHLAQIRQRILRVVTHYDLLELEAVAEAALNVKTKKPCAVADAFAQWRLAVLHDNLARREFGRWLARYRGEEPPVLDKKIAAVIEEYQQFVTDRPDSPPVLEAVNAITAFAQLYAGQNAHDVAAKIHGDLAAFVAETKVPALAPSLPDQASIAQQIRLRQAQALEAHARRQITLERQRTPDAEPPAKLTAEFQEALTAYHAFLNAEADHPLVGPAVERILGIAMYHVQLRAWSVADEVFGGLMESPLSVARPERLQFCRGLCRLGPAMPDDARKLLTAYISNGLRETRTRRGSGPDGERAAGLALGGGQGGGGGLGSDGWGRNSDGGLVDTLVINGPASGPASRYSNGSAAGTRMPVGSTDPAAVPSPARTAPAEEPAPSDEPADDAPDTQQEPTPPAQPTAESIAKNEMLAMIQTQEAQRAAQIARLREGDFYYATDQRQQQLSSQVANQDAQGRHVIAAPTLSDAELTRRQKAMDAAYTVFVAIGNDHPHTATAESARGVILSMVTHWRSLLQWNRAASLAEQFLADHDEDRELPKIRLEIGRDRLSWAARPATEDLSRQKMLTEVGLRFDEARKSLASIVADFPDRKETIQQARWELAQSFLRQARAIDAFGPTLARGQYVRAARELRQVAVDDPNHPQAGTIPDLLNGIAAQMESRQYSEEAVMIFNDLAIAYPRHGLAQQAAIKVAQIYHQRLALPLRAAEAYQELNFSRGGNDTSLQDAIFQIGTELKEQRRWVESMHVLETFVDSFPRHPQAGQALATVGQIHQTNEAWEDAIVAYRRVLDEFDQGQWIQDAKWAIAECTINLSHWTEAADAFRAYVQAYPEDAKKDEANRRIEILKDLARYQALVDEPNQRKAFDAQFQIARIVQTDLNNPVKAIIEYRKVVSNWSDSHLADDALFAVGKAYLDKGDTVDAREALLAMAEQYPTSPLADDALLLVGQSYENEADKLASATRQQTIDLANTVAQRRAYESAQTGRREQEKVRRDNVSKLKTAGKGQAAEVEEAFQAANYGQFNDANVLLNAQKAAQVAETLSAMQLADRQDKINAALREAVDAYSAASQVPAADKADEALLQMATIYDQRLKDSEAAVATWLEIVKQFSGTTVAEDASWRIAEYYQRRREHDKAIEAYKAFLRNYRRSPKAGQAQFAIAENYEQLNEWVNAMDSYTNYLTNFPEGPLSVKAKEQIGWIKTYRL